MYRERALTKTDRLSLPTGQNTYVKRLENKAKEEASE